MYGRRFFGGSFFAPRYFGDGGGGADIDEDGFGPYGATPRLVQALGATPRVARAGGGSAATAASWAGTARKRRPGQ